MLGNPAKQEAEDTEHPDNAVLKARKPFTSVFESVKHAYKQPCSASTKTQIASDLAHDNSYNMPPKKPRKISRLRPRDPKAFQSVRSSWEALGHRHLGARLRFFEGFEGIKTNEYFETASLQVVCSCWGEGRHFWT